MATQLPRPDLHVAIEQRFPDNVTEDITPQRLRDGLHELVDSVFVTATDTGAVPNVPLYQMGTAYIVGFTVRYTPLGGNEGFYYSLRAGKLSAPQATSTTDWKVVPGPVTPTALSQAMTLFQAQGLDNSGVIAGRQYLIDCGPDAQGRTQMINVRGVSNDKFDVEATLEVDTMRTPVTDFDVQAGSWTVKVYGGTTPAQLATKVDKVAGKGLSTNDYTDSEKNKVAALQASSSRSTHSNSNGLRTNGPLLFQYRPSQLSIFAIDNITTLTAQVNYRDPTQPSIWVAGALHSSASSSQTDLDALCAALFADTNAIPAAGLVIAGEVLIRTQPIDTTLPSNFFLDGLGVGFYSGISRNFRVNYTGPPIGNLTPNPQFLNTNDFWVCEGTGNGWTFGGGQANTVNGNPNGDQFRGRISVMAGNYQVTIGVQNQNSNTILIDFENPIGTHNQQYFSGVGDHVFTISAAAGVLQIGFPGVQDLELSHVYLVALP